MTGTLSLDRISVPHRGHLDRGATIDSLRGTRSVTTVRKDPTTRPNTAKTAIRRASTTQSVGTTDVTSSSVPYQEPSPEVYVTAWAPVQAPVPELRKMPGFGP